MKQIIKYLKQITDIISSILCCIDEQQKKIDKQQEEIESLKKQVRCLRNRPVIYTYSPCQPYYEIPHKVTCDTWITTTKEEKYDRKPNTITSTTRYDTIL